MSMRVLLVTREVMHLMSMIHKQGRQCTYNVTLGRVRGIIVAAEEHRILHNLCLYL